MGRKQIEYSVTTRTQSKYWYYRISGMANFQSTGIPVEWRGSRPANRAEALRFAESKLLEAKREEAKAVSPTLGEYAKDFYLVGKCPILEASDQRRPIKKSTRENLRRYLKNYIIPQWGTRRPAEIGGREVEEWILSLPHGNSFRNKLLQTFRAVMRQAVLDGHASGNVIDSVQGFSQRPQSERVSLTEAQITALFPEDEAEFSSIWDYPRLEWSQTRQDPYPWHGAMFYLMLTTGMRSAEIRALRWTDVLFSDHAVICDKQIDKDGNETPPKKSEYRAIPLFPRAHRMMYRWYQCARFRENSDYCFTNTGRPLAANRLREYLEAARLKAGVPQITPHQFRHTFVTRVSTALSGQAPDFVRLLSGHASEHMRRHYDHPDRGALLDRMKPVTAVIQSRSTTSW